MKISQTLLFAALLAGPFSASAQANDWPRWHGADHTDISKETGLMKQWPAEGPKQAWLYKNAGNGYAGFSIVNGWLFTMGTRDGKEVLLALNANTGKEIWASPMSEIITNDWGDGPRGTPTVDADRIYAISGPGTLVCANVKDGKILWQKTMAEFGGKIADWGYTESPLIDGSLIVCTPGGPKGAIVALDKMTGALVWQSKEFTDRAQYSSLVPAKINGVPHDVQRTTKSFVGVSAKDGKLLWKTDFPGRTAVIPTPIVRDNYVYITAGYGAGSKLVKIGPNNDVSVVYENKVMKNRHGGVILVGDYLYGCSEATGWVCQNFMTGAQVWSSKKLGDGGTGCSAEGMLYCIEERKGTVALVQASPEGWKEQGRFNLSELTNIRKSAGGIWTHPVVSNGKLYLRDQDLIFCYDVKAK